MAHVDADVLTTAQQAFECFQQGLSTGQWQTFLDRLSDDFTFWFPAGPFRGLNQGKDKASEFFQSVSRVFGQSLTLTIQRISTSDTTVVFEVKSEGLMLGHPYENQAAIAFDVRDTQICGYREYLNVIFQLPVLNESD